MTRRLNLLVRTPGHPAGAGALEAPQGGSRAGPVLDTFYSQLKKCGDLTCTGQPFTEHRNAPDLRPSEDGDGLDWEQSAGALRTAIEADTLPAGADIPSVRDLQAFQGIARSTLQRALRAPAWGALRMLVG
jgi:hypothetical protein